MHFWKKAFVRAWLYCEKKKGTVKVRKKNQNPVWKRSGLDGGFGRGGDGFGALPDRIPGAGL